MCPIIRLLGLAVVFHQYILLQNILVILKNTLKDYRSIFLIACMGKKGKQQQSLHIFPAEVYALFNNDFPPLPSFLLSAFSSVPSTYSTHQALPSQLPPSSVSDSNKAQQMLWLISIVCSIAVALSIATIGTMCSVFLCRRVKAMKVKRYMQLT